MFMLCSLLTGLAAAPDNAWLDYLVPLPRQVELRGSKVVPPGEISLALAVVQDPPELVQGALELLKSAVSGAGAPPQVVRDAAQATIILATTDQLGNLPGVKPPDFSGLPNPEQACAIRVLPGDRLLLCATTPLGLRYAALSVSQLVAAKVQPGRVTLPLVELTDSPSIQQRGFWGGDAQRDLEWLSAHKFNLLELHATLGFADDGTPTATMPDDLLAEADLLGITVVPIIHHIEQLARTGIFERHPELDGGASPKNPNLHFLKLDHPALRKIVGKWFSDLAKYPTVNAITVWLSEDSGAHKLADPTKNTFVAEVELMHAAVDEARKVKPDLQLRLLTTQASYQDNELVIAAARPDDVIIHYHGSRTYNCSRAPILDDYFKAFADRGGWLGVCPQVIPDWRGVAPWHGGEFVQARMQEFVDKGVRTLVAYAPAGRPYDRYQVEATAEWSWNPAGRGLDDFAHSYAVRCGVGDPDAFTKYVALTGPVGWDLYGSRVIVIWCYGSSLPLVAKGGLKLGGSVLGEFQDEAQFETDIKASTEAREIAEKLGDPQLVHEAEVLGGWTRILRLQYQLSGILPKAKELEGPEREHLAELLVEYDTVSRDTAAALSAWGAGVAAETGGKPGKRFEDTVDAILDEGTDLAELGETLGFPDRFKAYRQVEVGTWSTEQFEQQGTRTFEFDVTERVDGPGRYEVEFSYRKGLLGLAGHRVALVAQTGDPNTRRELGVDQHDSHCGAWNKDHLYVVELTEPVPDARYLVLATVSAGSPQTPREKRTSEGIILFRKLPAD